MNWRKYYLALIFKPVTAGLCRQSTAPLPLLLCQIPQALMLILGTALLAEGLCAEAKAYGDGLQVTYNDIRISDAVNAVLTYLEGSFGALVMVAAGLGAILSAAFGQYRAALGCLIIAVGSFILRSVLSTFFNDQNITA